MKLSLCIAFSLLVEILCAQDRKKSAVEHFDAGELAYNAGKYDEALNEFNLCLSADAGYYEAYASRAATKERLKDWPGAVTDYSIYIEKFPNQTEAVFSRGLARYQAGQYEAAADDFTEFLQMPTSGETQSIFYRQSVFGGGTDQIVSAQGQIRDYVLNYIGLAQYKIKHLEKAICYFDTAITINPNEADYYAHRGLAKQDQGDLDGAEADYRKAISINDDHVIARYNLGVLLKKKNDDGAAEEQLNEAIERNPDLSYPYLERAYYRLASGNLNGALEDYDKGISLNENDIDSWVNRGLVKEKLNNLPGAYNDFTRAIKIKNDYEKAWFCRGNVLTKMNKLKEAEEDYSIAILYYPEYAQAFTNRAIVRHRLGRLREACTDIEKARTLGATGIDNIRSKVCK
ncbi:MAG TPA: tetratricopeptide repeat protein [Cyclobacteriaceae bacterium]|nr:tetratricopeptide repeat protein [Cyclobacteriaceae bacterium]